MISLGEPLRLADCRGLRPNPTCMNMGKGVELSMLLAFARFYRPCMRCLRPRRPGRPKAAGDASGGRRGRDRPVVSYGGNVSLGQHVVLAAGSLTAASSGPHRAGAAGGWVWPGVRVLSAWRPAPRAAAVPRFPVPFWPPTRVGHGVEQGLPGIAVPALTSGRHRSV